MVVASSTALFATFASSIGDSVYTTIGVILVIMAALIAIGYAVRKFTRKISGRKF